MSRGRDFSILTAFALCLLFAASAWAGPASSDGAADVVPVADRAAVTGKPPAGQPSLAGAKVAVRRFPQTVGDSPTAVLWDNGPLVTHPGGGFGGADASALQTGLGMTTFGYTASDATAFRLSDDFTVPPGETWDITTITMFGYQTGSTTTSTFDVAFLQIWDGPPNAGGVVVFGDTTTNRYNTSAWTNAYRVTDTTLTNNQRPIMGVAANVNASFGEGNYWIDFQLGGTLASGPFCPPITILGQTTTGDGLQWNGAAWVTLLDVGLQGIPFVVEGTAQGNASITLDKTVGEVPAVCAVTDSITVSTGTQVFYCFTVENTGGTALNFHDLVDDHLGTILDNFPFVLAPGATAELIVSDVANATVTNTGTWTGFDSIGGYSFDDTIAVNFEDISGTGTGVTLGDDEVSAAEPMGFSFDYFGTSYSDAYISSNGFLTMLPGQSNGCCTGQPIPTAGTPDAVIAGWWEDLLPPGGGTIHYQTLGSAPNRRFIVQFTDIPHFGGGGGPVTMQYKLFEGTNVIEVHYLAAPSDGGQHSAGIENETGTVGVQYFLGNTGLTTPLAVRYSPATSTSASASDTATVTIADPDIDLSATSFTSTLPPGQTDTQQLDIDNLGTGDLDWTLAEAPPVPLVSIPASDGQFQRGKHADSAGMAPNSAPRSTPTKLDLERLLGANTAYSWNSQNGPYYTVFDITDPANLPNITPFDPTGQFIGAGEYVDGLVYMVDVANNMWEVDPPTGTILNTFTATAPPGGETYSGMALDPTSGVVYAGSTNVATSSLFTMDVTTGAATLVGPITNCPGLIGLAIDGNGDLWGYDIVGDVLLSIDKTTGAGTIVGSIGFDANFGQGMGWHAATDTLYMAAFNNGTFLAELRSVDRTTGNTTLVGVLGSTTPGGLNQLSWLGTEIGLGPCSAPSDLPWLSVNPASGTTPPGGTSTVDVTFDSTGLTNGTYDGFLCVESNDPDEGLIEVPVTLTVGADTMPFFGDFEEGDTSDWTATVP